MIELEAFGPSNLSFSAGYDVAGFGFAGAFEVNRMISIGASVTLYEASINASRSTRSVRLEDQPPGRPVLETERAEDEYVAVNLGMLIRPAERWTVGLFYRQGPEFDATGHREFPDREDDPVREPFSLPDVFGAGASFRATPELLLSFEWDRIGYSSLARSATVQRLGLGRFEVDDADELRAGVEYSFWGLPFTPALRAGVWHDPDHKIRFVGTAECPGPTATTPPSCSAPDGGGLEDRNVLLNPLKVLVREAAFQPGSDKLHVTLGFGLVFGSHVQIDAAIDRVSSSQQLLSLSGVLRF